jgi:hypothetical protein
MGFDQAILNMPEFYQAEIFDLLATEVIPEVVKIPVAGR